MDRNSNIDQLNGRCVNLLIHWRSCKRIEAWIGRDGVWVLVAVNMFGSCPRHFILTLPLANEEFKWVPVIVSDA